MLEFKEKNMSAVRSQSGRVANKQIRSQEALVPAVLWGEATKYLAQHSTAQRKPTESTAPII